MTDDDAVETFYTDDRWQNWLDRLEEEDLDPENEDSARLLLNLQDDAAIAVVKVLAALDEDRIDEDRAVEEIRGVRDIVLADVDFDDEDKVMLIDGVQTSLVPVFYAAEEYVVGGVVEGDVTEFVRAAAEAEAEDDLDAALGYVVQAGTRVIDGETLDIDVVEDLEYGLVSEWVNGLDSLQSAIEDPEVVEEED
ncbi:MULTISPECIES: DUF2150 family protein [unclassified Halorubrum]|uniref:DUF2150 family protein n=1 Tax=unclassified Halorubrum TaxID=2642239 RepID=UPI000B98CF00|nr:MULTISPECIES: DUF2150 family protein [unclassified Halorubrum]OYR41348.1 hypothetical protein DJ81_12890 [Halorubrum sp. Hd13]OYR52294.1 hypothetical protein DJ74_01650 [Halorubrum sp. Ea8]OYR55967.1 hypothetical protein DJ73_00790 [Halorubrum sp. Ea1]